MARVILAMASSSTTRCGLLLSSEMAGGTALGSLPSGSRLPAPRVAGFSFMGEGESGTAAATVVTEGGESESAAEFDEESMVLGAGEVEFAGCALLGCMSWAITAAAASPGRDVEFC